MISKLYNLKKTQTDQKLILKGQVLSDIEKCETQMMFIKNKIDSASVQNKGSISDFSLLQIHKNTMRYNLKTVEEEKNKLKEELKNIEKDIVQLQKETEQYSVILEEEKAEALKKLLLVEQEASEEYIQSKYIKGD